MTTTIPQQNVTPPQGFTPGGWQGTPWNFGYPGYQPGIQTQVNPGVKNATTGEQVAAAPFNPYGVGVQGIASQANLPQISGQPVSVFATTPFGFNPISATPMGFGQFHPGSVFNGIPNSGIPFGGIGFNGPQNPTPFGFGGFNSPIGFGGGNPMLAGVNPWNSAFGGCCGDSSCPPGFGGSYGFGSFGPDFSTTLTSNVLNPWGQSAFGFNPAFAANNWQNGQFHNWQGFGGFNNTPWNNTPWNGYAQQRNFGTQHPGIFNSFHAPIGLNTPIGFNTPSSFNTPINGIGTGFHGGINPGFNPGFNNSLGGFAGPINTPINGFNTPFNGFNTPFNGFNTPFNGLNTPINGFNTPINGFSTTPFGFGVPFGVCNTANLGNWNTPNGFANPGFVNGGFQPGFMPFGGISGYNPYGVNPTNIQCDNGTPGGLNLNNQAA